MEEIEGLIQQVSKVKDGFKPIQTEAENILGRYPMHDSLQLAHRLYGSEVHQARMSERAAGMYRYRPDPVKKGAEDVTIACSPCY